VHNTFYEQFQSKISLNYLKLEGLQISNHKYETDYSIQRSVRTEQLF